MRAHNFKLAVEALPFLDGPAPDEINVPLHGHKATVKKGETVRCGALLAEHAEPGRGDKHAPFDGEVTKVTPQAVTVTRKNLDAAPAAAEGEAAAEAPKPHEGVKKDITDLTGDELAAALKSLGMSTRGLPPKGTHIVINAVTPEPGILWAGELLGNYAKAIEAGIGVLKRMLAPLRISAVIPEGCNTSFGSDVQHHQTKPSYPNSVDALVIKAATGKENPEGVFAVSLHRVWRMGLVALSGQPLQHTVMTVQDKNYLVIPGTSIREVLAHAGIAAADGDYVSLGGLMRGKSISDLDQGVPPCAIGLFHVPAAKYAKVRENPCINCGACVQFCPSGLMANVIGRNAEFQNYEECKRLSVSVCMDCGLCGYYCIARRPMLQYMREVKEFLAMEENALPMQQ